MIMPKFKANNIGSTDANGFALVNVIWLLLLGAALVSAIQLATIASVEEQAFDQKQIERELAMESAFETAMADILFYGNGGAFRQLPATTNYQIDGFSLTVHISGENGKLDLNQAEPALIDRALRGFDIPSSQRESIIDAILAKRGNDVRIQTVADIEQIFGVNGVELSSPFGSGDFCPSRFFTPFSGLAQPSTVGMEPRLARALNLIPAGQTSEFQTGQVNRVRIEARDGPPLITYIRITGNLDQPVKIIDWGHYPAC